MLMQTKGTVLLINRAINQRKCAPGYTRAFEDSYMKFWIMSIIFVFINFDRHDMVFGT